jgi:hypothetical protein
MAARDYRHLSSSALLVTEEVSSAEALAIASMPGGCEVSRFPLFVEMDATITRGAFARFEFVLPGKPGRWLAAGEVMGTVEGTVGDTPKGLCVELIGLTLTTEAPAPVSDESQANSPVESSVGPSESTAEPAAEIGVKDYDPSELELDEEEVCGMLADLLGREVEATDKCKLPAKMKGNALVAIFRDDANRAAFAIAFDKGGAVRIGGALTMLPEVSMSADAKSKGMIEGEPLENVSEVLNIMSALFHEAGTPHVVLAEVINGAEMREHNDGELVALFDAPRWSLAHGLEIEDYGSGEVYLAGS